MGKTERSAEMRGRKEENALRRRKNTAGYSIIFFFGPGGRREGFRTLPRVKQEREILGTS
ncbi:unnamed protein product, partial [Nesidiocoris tenuis]